MLRRAVGIGRNALAAACTATLLAAPAAAQVGVERLAFGLDSPTYLTAPPGDGDRVFVAELGGDIEILDRETGVRRGVPFLSIPGLTDQGLLGLAFHPDYASNGYFYVYAMSGSTTSLVRYSRSAGDPDLADPGSATTVLRWSPIGGHIGGWIGFGPDGTLLVMIGDSGGFHQWDPANNSQSITGELLGNILRIDVDGDDFPGDPERNYAVPADNPYVGVTGEDEIWSSGVRNPFRGSFDRATGDFYFGDVGEDDREEVNVQVAGNGGGQNYGWRLREGTIATPGGGVGGPQPPGGVDPDYEYTHGPGSTQGYSITGGYVYRGPVRELRGQYFFGDYVSERIWSFRFDTATRQVSDFTDWTSTFVPDQGTIDEIVSFGEDAAGNLYIVDLGGEVFRVTGPVVPVPALSGPALGGVGVLLLMAGAGLVGVRRRRGVAAG